MHDLFQRATPADIRANGFDEFWGLYPRKVGKVLARKAYAKALKSACHDKIICGLAQQLPAMQSKEPKFIPHASTWLNQERWEDEPEEPTRNTSAQNPRGSASFDEARERALRSAARGPERGGCEF